VSSQPAASAADVVKLEQVVAGVVTTLASYTWNFNYLYHEVPVPADRVRQRANPRLRLQRRRVHARQPRRVITAIATGGTLATGKPGVRDRNISGAGFREFTEVAVSTPAAEPVAINSSRTIQFRYDDTIRDDSTGTYTGRPPSYRGSRCLIPVGTSRVLAKARRNDVVTAVDDQVTDSTKIQVAYTPRYLAVPR
jgi:hypothetical protein